MPASAGVRFPAIHLPEIDPMKRGPRKGLPLWGTRRTGSHQGYEVKSRGPCRAFFIKRPRSRDRGLQLVEKGCRIAGFFLWDVFSRTCAGKKHRNPPNFRKNLAKPARRPGPNCREKPSEAVFRQSQDPDREIGAFFFARGRNAAKKTGKGHIPVRSLRQISRSLRLICADATINGTINCYKR